jgi:hypothetical protein
MSDVVQLKSVEVDYSGGCPRCGSTGGVLNVGRVHWLCCDRHKIKWSVGSNLFPGWREEDASTWNENAERLAGYSEVEPLPAGKRMVRA